MWWIPYSEKNAYMPYSIFSNANVSTYKAKTSAHDRHNEEVGMDILYLKINGVAINPSCIYIEALQPSAIK